MNQQASASGKHSVLIDPNRSERILDDRAAEGGEGEILRDDVGAVGGGERADRNVIGEPSGLAIAIDQ